MENNSIQLKIQTQQYAKVKRALDNMSKAELIMELKKSHYKIESLKAEKTYLSLLVNQAQQFSNKANLENIQQAHKQIEDIFKNLESQFKENIEQYISQEQNYSKDSIELNKPKINKKNKIDLISEVKSSKDETNSGIDNTFINNIRSQEKDQIIYELTDNKMIFNRPLSCKREYYQYGSQHHAPAKKGITFTCETWKTIMQNINQIDQDIKEQSSIFYAKKK